MEIAIKIPNKDIPKHQEVIDIRLHFIDGHIVDADGYGFVELPKGHGRLIDADELLKCKYDITNWNKPYGVEITSINKASTILEASESEKLNKKPIETLSKEDLESLIGENGDN